MHVPVNFHVRCQLGRLLESLSTDVTFEGLLRVLQGSMPARPAAASIMIITAITAFIALTRHRRGDGFDIRLRSVLFLILFCKMVLFSCFLFV